MEIAVIGLSYKNADVDLRGEVAFTTSMKCQATQVFQEKHIKEFMILSTCNRSEIYIATQDMERDIQTIKNYYKKLAGTKIEDFLYVKQYEVAIQHIYQVASGLDSLILGEDEILGQMKQALDFSIEQGSSKKYLTKVVREAITFSKKVRNAYKLSENQLSVASIAIKYLKEVLGTLENQRILMIGTGEMGQLLLKYIELEKTGQIYLTNRTHCKESADIYAGKNIVHIEYDERYRYLDDVDIVISATASPHIIIERGYIDHVKPPITFLDMAVPRDIDPAIDTLDHVSVITLDTLRNIASKHQFQRQEMAHQIKRLIHEEVKEIELWILRAKADGIIKAFHEKQGQVLEQGQEILEGLQLNSKQLQSIQTLLKRSTWQMIKEPVTQLKSIQESETMVQYKMLIEKLFDFGEGE
jgi:glutamyl-tRNA reductase